MNEDATTSLGIVVTPHDGDDTVTITITGVPSGATLSNGIENSDGSWTLTPDQLSGLSLTAGEQGNATLHVVVASSEGGLDPVFSTHDIALITNAVAEAPTLEGTPTDVSGDEGGIISLDIELHTHDSDDTITSIVITGVPSDAFLTHGFHNSDGSWTLTDDDLTGLQVILGEEGETTLHVVATAREGGEAASSILGFEDAPVAETGDFTGWTTVGDTSVQTSLEGFTATEGTHFAVLDSANQSESAVESFLGLDAGSLQALEFSTPAPSLVTDGSAMQTTVTLNGGDELSFDWNFDGNDYVDESGTFNDFAFVTINGQITLLDDVVNEGDFTASGWQTFTFTAPSSGEYTLGFGEFNGGDDELNSQLLVDNVQIVTPSGGTASASTDIHLTTTPVAEPANLGDTPGTDISVGEDGTVSLGIVVQTADDDDTIVSITITGVPSDATLSAGERGQDGTWTLSSDQLSGLTLTAGEEGTSDLHVVAFTTEAGLPPVTASTDISLTVNPVAEQASLAGTETAVSVNEDGTVSINIDVTAHDGDDTITSITISGVPSDATLSTGTENSDGTWTLTPDQLSGLTLTAGEQGSATLHVVVSSTEGDLPPATASTNISVTVNPVAEPASLAGTESAVTVNEDGTVSLDIVVTPHDGDDTITSVTITGVPSDATLSAGTHNSDGSWTLTPEQLSGLTLTAGEEGTANLHVVVSATEAGVAASGYTGGTLLDFENVPAPVETSDGATFQVINGVDYAGFVFTGASDPGVGTGDITSLYGSLPGAVVNQPGGHWIGIENDNDGGPVTLTAFDGSTFTLNSGHFAAAFGDTETMTISGYDSLNNLVWTETDTPSGGATRTSTFGSHLAERLFNVQISERRPERPCVRQPAAQRHAGPGCRDVEHQHQPHGQPGCRAGGHLHAELGERSTRTPRCRSTSW